MIKLFFLFFVTYLVFKVTFAKNKNFPSHNKFSLGSKTLSLTFSNDYQNYNISINGKNWLSSGTTNFHSSGKWHSLTINGTKFGQGEDTFGIYESLRISWLSENDLEFHTLFKTYPSEQNIIVFSQIFPEQIDNTNTNNYDDVISSFPSFLIQDASSDSIELGYVHFAGSMASWLPQIGNWDTVSGGQGLIGGVINSGPLCLFESTLNDAIVISPLSNFMAFNLNVTSNSNSASGKEARWGIQGNMTYIPSNYEISFIITLGSTGKKNSGSVNSAMKEWGKRLLQYYGRKKLGNAHIRDYTLQYLGYSTDNGAFYYYNTEPNQTYEQTIIDIRKYSDEIKIPYRYILLDSWWYYQGTNNGLLNWTARPDIFPNGMNYVYNKTNWKIQAHNRYFALNNIYWTNNGGQYPFIYSSYDSLPETKEFWDYLFDINKDWGLTVYEQDWLSKTQTTIPDLLTNITSGRNWLLQMGISADEHDLSIQYCMSYPRHVMTSVELPSVTQARASNDYQPGNSQWTIGMSSIFTSSIDIAPSKDSYWSMQTPQIQPHYKTVPISEPYSRLQSVVATLSNGPVQPGDQIGYSNASLIMRHCNQDGLLLRPQTSATILDSWFNYKVFGTSGPNGQVWSTYSRVAGRIYLYVLAANLVDDYNLSISELGHHYDDNDDDIPNDFLIYENNTTDIFLNINNNNSLLLKACEQYNFEYYTFIPLIDSFNNSNTDDDDDDTDAWYLQGEIDKWISVSSQRFEQIINNDDGSVHVRLLGSIGETVNVGFVNAKTKQQKIISCTFGESQALEILVPNNICQSI